MASFRACFSPGLLKEEGFYPEKFLLKRSSDLADFLCPSLQISADNVVLFASVLHHRSRKMHLSAEIRTLPEHLSPEHFSSREK
jgi:hypothetical protein